MKICENWSSAGRWEDVFIPERRQENDKHHAENLPIARWKDIAVRVQRFILKASCQNKPNQNSSMHKLYRGSLQTTVTRAHNKNL